MGDPELPGDDRDDCQFDGDPWPCAWALVQFVWLPGQVGAAHDARMRFSINIPNFGDFADPRNVATVAAAAEESGWDGLFVWDHVHYRAYSGRPFGDAWLLLTAAALATSRIRVGTLLTPVARYRPQQLARQVATLDNLSRGRVVFAAGLGGPVDDEYGSFGDSTDRRVLAERLDEGLELLGRFWTGEAVDHHGRHYQARNVSLPPCSGPGRRCGSGDSGRTVRPCDGPRGGTARFPCSRTPCTDARRTARTCAS